MTNKLFKAPLIYFIQGETTGLIKIGKTHSTIEKRLANLQTGSPDKLKLLGISFEPYSNEKALHGRFNNYRSHGEWFEPNSELLSYIESMCFK